MSDVFSPQKRSEVMALIRGKGNKSTELRFMALLRLHRIKGWRRHWDIIGKPDFAFPKQRVAVFVDGDFWHGNPQTSRIPKSNADFWATKIGANRARDRMVTRVLRTKGWRVLRVWESNLAKHPEKISAHLVRVLESSQKTKALTVLSNERSS